MAAGSGSTFSLARNARGVLRRVPVWTWRFLMLAVGSRERARFNTDPLTDVAYSHDLDYGGDGLAMWWDTPSRLLWSSSPIRSIRSCSEPSPS